MSGSQQLETRNIEQQQPPIILLVEDCLEDRETFGRYLLADSQDDYRIFEAETAAEGLALYRQCQPDVVLLDYRLPDSDGLEFIEQIQQLENDSQAPILLLTGQGNEQVAVRAMKAGVCDYLVKGRISPHELRSAVDLAIENARLRVQLKRVQAERERQSKQEKLIAQIANQIRACLGVEKILDATVAKVREFLSCDRVFIYRFEPDWNGIVVAESVGDGWLPILNARVEDTYFVKTRGEDYRLGRIQAVADIYSANLTDCHVELLARFQIRANLAVPILQEDSLWGLLVANHCSDCRTWQPQDIDLLQYLTTQVGIALQQAELYERIQCELVERKRTEEALRQSEKRYRSVVEDQTELICRFMPDCALTFVNGAYCRFFGLSYEALIGRNFLTLIPEIERDRVRQDIEALNPQRPVAMHEHQVLLPDGQIAWQEWTNRAIFDADGRLVEFQAVGRDITDRKRAENLLRQNQATIRRQLAEIDAIYTTAPVGLCFFDTELRYVRINQQLADINGLSIAEHLGRTVSEILPELANKLEPIYRQVIETGEPIVNSEVSGTTRAQPDVERYWLASYYPLKDSSDRVLGINVMVQEISDRKRAEAALQEADRRIITAWESMTDAYAALDRDWRITYTNEAATQIIYQLTNLEPREFLGKTHWEVFPWSVGQTVEREYRRAMTEQVAVHVEVFYEPTGNWLESHVYPSAEGLGIYFRDISDRKQAENQLKNSERRIASLAKLSPVGIFRSDRDGYDIYANDRCCEIIGLPPEEALGLNWVRALHPDDRDRVLEEWLQAVGNHLPFYSEYRFLHADGTIRWVIGQSIAETDDEGQIIGYIGTLTDISDRKQTEAVLRESEEQRRLAMDLSHVGSWDWNLKTNEVVWNDNHFYLLGLKPDEAPSKYQTWRDRVHPEDIALVEQALSKAKANRTDYQAEYRVIYPDGTVRWLLGKGRALYNDRGEPARMLGIILDISDRKCTEKSLRENEERLQLGMEVAGFAIARFDYATNTVTLSPEAAALYGLPLDELVVPRSRIHETFHPEEREEMAQIIAGVLDPLGSGWFARDHRVVWRNGEVRWLSVRKQVFFDRDGEIARPNYAILAAIDITDRKRAEQQLQQQAAELNQLNEALTKAAAELTERNEELDRFTRTVSHDLKAPLRAIANLAQWIVEDISEQLSQDNQRQMSLLLQRVRRMENLIDGLLVYSRVGGTEVSTVTVNVGELLAEIVDSLAPPPTFTVSVQPQMPTIVAKRLLLSQVFSNLIGNAIKHHNRSDGRIEISATRKGNYYEFTVTDDGPGIAPENQERVFGIFQTLKSRDVKESTGIGLSIVKKIVESEGGNITVESELGSGATFRFTWRIDNTT